MAIGENLKGGIRMIIKKINQKILLVFLLWITVIDAVAQEQDPWVGTWTSESYVKTDWKDSPKDSDGTYLNLVKADYKDVFRITKSEEGYLVRGKTIKVSDPNDVSYHRSYIVTSIEGNTMHLRSFVKKEPFYVNGKIDEYSDITYYYQMTLKNGVLHYSYYRFDSENYDKNMNYKGKESFSNDLPGKELDCYNDDW